VRRRFRKTLARIERAIIGRFAHHSTMVRPARSAKDTKIAGLPIRARAKTEARGN